MNEIDYSIDELPFPFSEMTWAWTEVEILTMNKSWRAHISVSRHPQGNSQFLAELVFDSLVKIGQHRMKLDQAAMQTLQRHPFDSSGFQFLYRPKIPLLSTYWNQFWNQLPSKDSEHLRFRLQIEGELK